MTAPILALDTGSPLVSVAVARDGEVVAMRSVEQERSSTLLLPMIDEALREAGIGLAELGGITVLRGPGSFTGLRIGLATVLGLHQALGVRATALPSLRAMAVAVPPAEGGVVISVVDALRGDWSAQAFAGSPLPRPLGEMELLAGAEVPRLAAGRAATVVGFGVERLAELPGWPAAVRVVEPGPLAPAAALLAASPETVWDAGTLTAAVYSRPPAITLPRPRASA
ncbi:MAG: tRNA (adenosine(37)-N6)-threonylcarbamoyltransferase complex dimerization subunit type 1 TsaB [Thermoanaerobaculia bacterium]